jgi:hypothetical protein
LKLNTLDLPPSGLYTWMVNGNGVALDSLVAIRRQ